MLDVLDGGLHRCYSVLDVLDDDGLRLMATFSTTYKITSLSDWTAVVEGDTDGDGAGGPILEIKGGSELRSLTNPSREAMLGAVAHFGGSLASTIENEAPGIDDRLLLSLGTASAGTANGILEAAAARPEGHPLKPEDVSYLHDASARIISLMLADAGTVDPMLRQMEERAELAIDLLQTLMRASRQELDALIVALRPSVTVDQGDDFDVRAAESRARLLMKAMFMKVRDESLTVAQIRDELKLSRQRLKQLRDEDRLFAVDIPYQKGLVYPAWQFEASGRPRAAMQPLIRAAREAGLDALGFHLLMTGKREGGRVGVQLLDDGREELALGLVRAADR
jgi:hypothetical protein